MERGGQERDEKTVVPQARTKECGRKDITETSTDGSGKTRRIQNLLRLRARDGGREAVVPWMACVWVEPVHKRILPQLQFRRQEHLI